MSALCDGLRVADAFQLVSKFSLLDHLEDQVPDGQGTVNARRYYAARISTLNDELDRLMSSGGVGGGPMASQLLNLIRSTKMNFLADALRSTMCFQNFIDHHRPIDVTTIDDDLRGRLCCTFADVLLSMNEKGELA